MRSSKKTIDLSIVKPMSKNIYISQGRNASFKLTFKY